MKSKDGQPTVTEVITLNANVKAAAFSYICNAVVKGCGISELLFEACEF